MTELPTNTAAFTLESLERLDGARVAQRGSAELTGIVTDTRKMAPGAAFVALRGERFDGHAFLARAVALGASALVVSDASSLEGLDGLEGLEGAVSIVIVPDTLVALGELAHRHRERMEREGALRLVVAITGSVGKTTTRTMCSAALRALGMDVHETRGNLNNRVGAPLTLLALEPHHEAAVIEVGMSVPGEIAALARIVRPHVAIVTSVTRVHTEGLGSLEAVAREKAALLQALPATPAPERVSVAIHTIDDPALLPLAALSPAPTRLGVGRGEDADVRLAGRRLLRSGHSECRYAIRPAGGLTASDVEVELALAGDGAAHDAACALALVVAVDGPRSLGAAARALGAIEPTPGRGGTCAGPSGSLLVDESYNASRKSMENALEAGQELAKARHGRLVAVLGDMLELGPYEAEEHAGVLDAAARAGVALLVGIGERLRTASERTASERTASERSASSSEAPSGARLFVEKDDVAHAVERVRAFVQPGDVVVIKGSRGMRLERVVEALRVEGRPSEGGS